MDDYVVDFIYPSIDKLTEYPFAQVRDTRTPLCNQRIRRMSCNVTVDSICFIERERENKWIHSFTCSVLRKYILIYIYFVEQIRIALRGREVI